MLRVLLLAVWMLAIFLFSAQQGSDSSLSSGLFVNFLHALGVTLPYDVLSVIVRKSAHAFAYFGLGVLTYRVFHLTPLMHSLTLALSAIFVYVHAVADEAHQLFVPGRSGQLSDIALDTVAGIAGVAVAALVTRLWVARLERKSADHKVETTPTTPLS